VLGVVLLLGITVTGITLVVAVGGEALDTSQSQLGTERAEKSLTQLDSKAAMVALGNSERQEVDVASMADGEYRVDDDAGWMNVTVTNTSSGDTVTVVNESLGRVTYDTGDSVVAYQGGGVWRTGGANGSTMVSPPEFHYRNATLTLPLISMNGTGDRTIDDSIVVERNGTSKRKYPNATLNENFTNPLQKGKVNVTVHSDYYQAWGSFFEERTDGVVYYDHPDEEVTVTLKTPAGKRKITNSISSTSKTGDMAMTGTGARADSYTSGDGDGYPDPGRKCSGTISAAGDIEIGGDAIIKGSVISGGEVESRGAAKNSACGYASDYHIFGDVTHVEGIEKQVAYTGTANEVGSGPEADSSVNSYVDDQVSAISKDNDNGNAATSSDITGNELANTDVTLGEEPGANQYYLTKLERNNRELTIDTGNGDVSIAVRDYVELDGDGTTVEVEGDGQVNIYVEGEADTSGYEFHQTKGSTFETESTDENATQMWVYGKDDFSARIEGSGGHPTKFVGVVYAPGGTPSSNKIEVKQADVYGGLVAGKVQMENKGSVHYDQNLGDEQAVPSNTKIIKITYLHISVNRIDVTSG
jgi:hypothetical protein